MFLKVFICLWTYTLCSTVVNATDINVWEQASQALRYQNIDLIRRFSTELSDEKAPLELFTSQQKKSNWETPEAYKERMLVPALLCKVGWKGTLFLMSSGENIQEFFQGNLPLCLKKPDAKEVVKKYFKDIENAAEKGQTGAVLCFMSLFYTEKDCWQHSFSHGFFKYCQKNGYGNFAKYVLHHSDDFSGHSRNMHSQFKIWKGQCLAEAFVTELKKGNAYYFEHEKEKLKKLKLEQPSVNALYVELAKQARFDLMDFVLTHNSWPQPSSEAKLTALQIVNSTFHEVLMQKNYSKAKAMLARKTENKPVLTVLHAAAAKAAQERSWQTVDDLLANMYDESRPVPQALTDDLFVCAVAYQNHEYFSLLTGENPFAVLTGEEWAYAPPSPPAFDRGLLETVKFRHQDMFDSFLDSYSEKLSETGMKAALEQAGKPKVNGSLYEINASSGFFDNHYQKCLKKKLGIPTIADLMLSSTNLDFELIAHNTIDLSSLVIPVIDAANSVTAGTEA
ncbi:MAG: hypothetical protein WCJ92_01045 [Alphaproteobacteria bacterium]